MRALSIRQPYAELILRGIKTIEYRSRPTRIIGEETGTGTFPASELPIPMESGQVQSGVSPRFT